MMVQMVPKHGMVWVVLMMMMVMTVRMVMKPTLRTGRLRVGCRACPGAG